MVEIVSIQDDEPECVLDRELEACLSSEDRALQDGAGEEFKPESVLPDRFEEIDKIEEGPSPDGDDLVATDDESPLAAPPSDTIGRAGDEEDEAPPIFRLRRLTAARLLSPMALSGTRITSGFDHALAGSRLDRLFPFCLEGLSGLLKGLLLFG